MSNLVFPLITASFIGAVSGYLGTLMLSKRMALVAGPLGHLALPGIALALIYNFDISLGAFPFIILGIFFIWLFEIRTGLPIESLTAIVFASGLAIALIFLPIAKAEAALIGDVLQIGQKEMIFSLILSILVFLIIKKIYSKLVLINISDDLAKAERVNIKIYNLLYLFCIAIMVALGVKVVGGLLTAALVSIPAATSRNFSKNLFQFSLFSILFGFLGSIIGIFLAKISGLAAGPLIIIVLAFFFLISLLFKNNK